LFVQGTVAGGIATRRSDIDLAFRNAVDSMEQYFRAVLQILRNKSYHFSKCFYTKSLVKLVHVEISGGMKGVYS
jgi:hypothetical protein